MMKQRVILFLLLLMMVQGGQAKIVLMGSNAPHGMIADGDFNATWANWRSGTPPPFWTMKALRLYPDAYPTDKMMGVHYGKIYGANELTEARSKVLDQNSAYLTPRVGDVICCELAADVEYRSKGAVALSLLFGEHERELIIPTPLQGSDRKNEILKGRYVITKADSLAGLPSLLLRMRAEDGIKVFVDQIDVWVEKLASTPPDLRAESQEGGVILHWKGQPGPYRVYRSDTQPENPRFTTSFKLLAQTTHSNYVDTSGVAGKRYVYVVTRALKGRFNDYTSGSNMVEVASYDRVKPTIVTGVSAQAKDASILISWQKIEDGDFAYYQVFRQDSLGRERLICSQTRNLTFEDVLARKGEMQRYRVCAVDYSGNQGERSVVVAAKTKLLAGASFSDLIQPLPLRTPLVRDAWGTDEVLPRDLSNGIESPKWSYWGGRPVKGQDGKYHLCVTRWREDALKGHWEWPRSLVAYAVADDPLGPYNVVREHAYDFAQGYGHNPDVIIMRDGSYALYALIDWKPTIFTAQTMAGPWTRLGVLSYDNAEAAARFSTVAQEKISYPYERNLSGVALSDGRILMVSKFGAMMESRHGLLGPYVVKTERIMHNPTLPKAFQGYNYEDPVIWQDSVQFHMIINAFLAKRAIYLRSPDGLTWYYDAGLAYTNELTNYENGVANHWDKLERPHVIQDEKGRATHLSLAVIDVDKDWDFGGDRHSSKNIILPLQRHRLLSLKEVAATRFEVLIKAEDDFNPSRDLDLVSLRFGSPKQVDRGSGCQVADVQRLANGDALLIFEGDPVLTSEDFVFKLLGKERDGDLVIGFASIRTL